VLRLTTFSSSLFRLTEIAESGIEFHFQFFFISTMMEVTYECVNGLSVLLYFDPCGKLKEINAGDFQFFFISTEIHNARAIKVRAFSSSLFRRLLEGIGECRHFFQFFFISTLTVPSIARILYFFQFFFISTHFEVDRHYKQALSVLLYFDIFLL